MVMQLVVKSRDSSKMAGIRGIIEMTRDLRIASNFTGFRDIPRGVLHSVINIFARFDKRVRIILLL